MPSFKFRKVSEAVKKTFLFSIHAFFTKEIENQGANILSEGGGQEITMKDKRQKDNGSLYNIKTKYFKLCYHTAVGETQATPPVRPTQHNNW